MQTQINRRERRERKGLLHLFSAFFAPSAVHIFFILALTLIFFYPLAFSDNILARGDTYAYHYPYWAARSAALLRGELPLWTPDLFMGAPLLANPQIGTFYPPNWVVAPLSPPDGIRLSLLLHVAWAGIGTFALARRTLRVSRIAALGAAAIFAFGGYLGAHGEQINQLQGLAWLPMLLLIFDWAVNRPFPRGLVLALALALTFFTGHTQTMFMALVALGVYALLTKPLRGLALLAVSGGIALIVTLPQLIPTLELMGVSNRRGGFNLNQATAFSLSPFIAGRGLLPSYDGMIFSEYIGYLGVIGLGLAIFGVERKRSSTTENTENTEEEAEKITLTAENAESAERRASISSFSLRSLRSLRFNPYFVLTVLGLFLAFGAFNPLYWLLAGLPGFNLFRVPARWLALFALGAALLAARGLQRVLDGERPALRTWIAVGIVIGGLALSTLLTGRLDDGTPAPPPTVISVIGWVAAGGVFVLSVLSPTVPIPPPQPSPEFRGGSKQTRSPQIVSTKRFFHSVLSPHPSVLLLLAALLLELFLAGRVLPTNNLLPPETFESQRFTVSQLLALNEGQTPPGRVLSISDGLFDPGDRAALEARWFDLSPDALQNAFVTVKQRELLAPNLPLLYGIPTIDGFDGGLLPTAYYTAFTSLLLPEGELRTLDGRLREGMASPECRGACVPDQRWLSLTNTRWLLLDKVYDVVHDGVFYDTGIPGGGALYPNVNDFEATEIRVLYHCADSPCDTTYVSPRGPDFAPADVLATLEGGQIIGRLVLDAPSVLENVSVGNNYAFTVDAVTLVDARTGDFQQLAPDGWRRVLSSDVKLYENLWVSPRAFMVYDAVWTPDTDEGTETALDLMRDPAFDSRREITLAGAGTNMETSLYDVFYSERSVDFHRYTAERVVIVVETELDGYLFLSDAYYPGWRATLDGASVPIYRADVMFRAVYIPAGTHEVVFTYSPY